MKEKSMPELRETALLLADMMPIIAVKFIKHAERMMRELFSPLQMHALFTLSCEGKLSMSDLARRIVVSKQQLTPIVDKLIAMELVIREHDQVDRRNVTIRLSEKGQEFIKDRRTEMSEIFAETLTHLSAEDVDILSRSSAEITTVLNKLP